MSKQGWVFLAIGAAVFFLAIGFGVYKYKSSPYSCYAGVDEQCPPEAWMKDFQWLKEKQEKYRAPQDVIDQMNGVNWRLRESVPKGYDFNEQKMRFVKTKTPTPQPTPEVKK